MNIIVQKNLLNNNSQIKNKCNIHLLLENHLLMKMKNKLNNNNKLIIKLNLHLIILQKI